MTTAPAASPPIIHALDHVVVAVRDLDAAVAVYRALLGRAPAWRAEAHGGGATVVTFALANVAVELMAPSGMGPTAERLTAVLDAQGEGLASLAGGAAGGGPPRPPPGFAFSPPAGPARPRRASARGGGRGGAAPSAGLS